MSRFLCTVLVGCLLCGVPAVRAEQQPVVIKLATLAPEGTVFYDALLKIGSEWARLSNGKVQVKIYAGGVAGAEPDMVRKLRIGQLQAVTISAIGMMAIDPSFAVLQVPGMMASYDELDYCREQLAPLLERRFADKGFVIINYGELGHMYFFTSSRAESVAELSQRKICTFATDQSSKEIWAHSGFNAVDIPLSEVLTSLQTGLIDGFINTPVFALSLQIFSKAKYMVDVSYGIAVAGTILQKAAWDKIEPGLQATLLAAARDIALQTRQDVRGMDARAITEMKKYGLEIVAVSPQDAPAWVEPVQKSYPEIREKLIPKDIFDRTLELRGRFRTQKK